LTTWINSARGQLAGESESIRVVGTLAVTSGVNVCPFSSISLSGATGVASVLKVNAAWYQVASGQLWITPRTWEWFSQYYLNAPVPIKQAPQAWCQYGQGLNGTIYVWPTPNASYTFNLDCVCKPVDLVDDSTAEAIPYPWTDAVPYFASYLALLSAQSAQRQADAQRYFSMYQEFQNRARRFSTPSVLPGQYEASPNVTRMGQLGLQAPKGGA
jgi:hypothetical protein